MCRGCGVDRPITWFRMPPQPGKRARAHGKCRTCRQRDAAVADALAQWDWAKALHKEVSMSLYKQGKPGLHASIDAILLRALLIAQCGKCAFDNEAQLLLPDGDLEGRTTLRRWRNSLDPKSRLRTPYLVRVTDYNPWIPGNIMLIRFGLVSLYHTLNYTAQGFQATVKRLIVRPPDVPQEARLKSVVAELNKQYFFHWKTKGKGKAT